MEIVSYTPEQYENLMSFLVENFPHRDKKYFEWWLKQSINVKKECWNRTFFIQEKDKIIACTTASWNRIKLYNEEQDFYWEGNTIVSELFRGKGLGRMIYEQMGVFLDRCTIGFTKAAYNIQPKVIPSLTSVNPVFVYLSVNRYFLNSLYRKWRHLRIQEADICYPLEIVVNNVIFSRIDNLEKMSFTTDGFWQNDDIEIIRDKSFFEKRFFNIHKKYVIYEGYLFGSPVCYFVVRLACYKGIDIISLVDFRYKSEDYISNIYKAVFDICQLNRIGFSLTLTSLKKKALNFYPIILRMNKKLYGATTIPKINKKCFLLITSADSDLDFVYYL